MAYWTAQYRTFPSVQKILLDIDSKRPTSAVLLFLVCLSYVSTKIVVSLAIGGLQIASFHVPAWLLGALQADQRVCVPVELPLSESGAAGEPKGVTPHRLQGLTCWSLSFL